MPNVPSDMTLLIDQDIEINASVDTVFKSLLNQLGPKFGPGGNPMAMKLEAFPGGRWFRDLGNEQGHFWGHVQVIKQPSLLEITGPLFMSYPAISHLQFRLTAKGDKTQLTLRHQALGMIEDEHRKGVATGWGTLLKGVQTNAEQNNK